MVKDASVVRSFQNCKKNMISPPVEGNQQAMCREDGAFAFFVPEKPASIFTHKD
jgi:hypothetical protein